VNHIIHDEVLNALKCSAMPAVQAVIADPPYFRVLENEWDNQWKTPEDYIAWCDEWVAACMGLLKDDGLFFIFGQPGKKEHTFIHLMSHLTRKHQFHDLIIWDRALGYSERRDSFTPQYEMILVLRKGEKVKFNKDAVRVSYDAATIELYLRDKRYVDKDARRQHLEAGRYATNILRYPSLKGSSHEKCGHPSQKPERLITSLIECCTDEGDLVLDPFIGSGTTAVVAQRLKRNWLGIEFKQEYVDMARKRIKEDQQNLVAKEPTYSGEVPCQKCGTTHWMHGSCPNQP
jgi:DNA modification methylase